MKDKEEQTPLQDDIQLKLDFIKNNYKFIQWEEAVRQNTETQERQLLSQLLDKDTAKHYLASMRKLLGSQANEVVTSVQSRLNPNKYRILIFIDTFVIPTAAQMNQMLCDFLNEMRCPPGSLGEENNEALFSFQWLIKEEEIYLLGPPFGVTFTGQCVEKWLRTTFEEKHKQAGFSEEFIALYNECLIVNSRKHVCTYTFNNHFLQHHLLPLAKAYFNQQLGVENNEPPYLMSPEENKQTMTFFSNRDKEDIIIHAQKNAFDYSSKLKIEKR